MHGYIACNFRKKEETDKDRKRETVRDFSRFYFLSFNFNLTWFAYSFNLIKYLKRTILEN